MDKVILEKLSVITDEEQEILNGNKKIDRKIYMNGKCDIITGKKLLKPEKQIAIRKHPRFIHFPEHSHDYIEILYMCKGSTVHIINGNKITLNCGDIIMLGQNDKQEILPAGKDDILVNFIVRPEFLSGTLSYLGNEESPLKQFILSCLRGENAMGYLCFKVADVKPIQNLMENLMFSLIDDTNSKRSINYMTVALLFMMLLEHTDKLGTAKKEQELAVKVLSYIEDNYVNASLEEIASFLHYDAAWLSREIKRRTGKTYTEHLQEKRISQAAWLLKNTDYNISDIAFSVGYENISYFHRLFRAHLGMSPKKYRNCK